MKKYNPLDSIPSTCIIKWSLDTSRIIIDLSAEVFQHMGTWYLSTNYPLDRRGECPEGSIPAGPRSSVAEPTQS